VLPRVLARMRSSLLDAKAALATGR